MKRLVVFAMSANSAATAQNVIHWAAPERASAGLGPKYYLPMGTPVMLRTLTQMSTKDNVPGDRVYLEVAENVMFRDQIVIPAGSPVLAEISAVQRNGHFGKKGKLDVRLIELQTPHGPVRLTGAANDEGKSGTAASVATIAFVSVLGFLIHGTSASIAPGTAVQGQLGSDLKFRYAGTDGRSEQSASAALAPTASAFRF